MPDKTVQPQEVLLHTCCAPCAVACVESLRGEGFAPVGFWDNPNIHPYTEYRARKNALIDYAKLIGMPLHMKGGYGLRDFVRAVAGDIDARCGYCYDVRMQSAASYAAENGFDSFTTTLLISPYQNHDQLIASARAAAEQFGVSFLYRDFRPLFREGQQKARELELYMQKYCGCVFSEEERYRKKPKNRG